MAGSSEPTLSAGAGWLHPAPWFLLLGSHWQSPHLLWSPSGHCCHSEGVGSLQALGPVSSHLSTPCQEHSHFFISHSESKSRPLFSPTALVHLQGTLLAILSLLPILFPRNLEGIEPCLPPLSPNKPTFLSLPVFFLLNFPTQDLQLSSTLWAHLVTLMGTKRSPVYS